MAKSTPNEDTKRLERNEAALYNLVAQLKDGLFSDCDFETSEELSAALSYIQCMIEPIRYAMKVPYDELAGYDVGC
jgi:hypothetical protein